MNLLSRLRLRSKLSLLLGLSILAVVISIGAAADTDVRNPMAIQNSASVRHHPAISEVAMIAVAQPLMMLTAAVAAAAAGLGGRAPRARKNRGVARGM